MSIVNTNYSQEPAYKVSSAEKAEKSKESSTVKLSTEAQEYLDDKINEYKEDNPAVAVDLTISKAYIKLSAGDTAGALEILETIDATRIEGQTLMKYYAAMRDVYKAMGDEAKYDEYVDLYFEIYLEVFNGGAGGE